MCVGVVTKNVVSRSSEPSSKHIITGNHSEENHLRNVVQRHIAITLEVCFCYTGSSGPGARFQDRCASSPSTARLFHKFSLVSRFIILACLFHTSHRRCVRRLLLSTKPCR
ncbi:hypothetical protein DPSP01_013222 [Paraphaeosphaeria sporulosa]